MKKLILIGLIFTLQGCSLLPKLTSAKPNFPEPYIDSATNQMPKCEELKQVPADTNTMTEVFKIIVDNYTLYYQCSNKVDGWAEWYDKVKKTYDKEK